MDITQLLAFSVKNKASDLHLSSGLPPMIRVHGDVRRINVDPLEHKQVHDMVYDIMNDSQRKAYEETLECDFSFEIQGLARFRVNAFNQNRGSGAVFRTIPSKILTLEQLATPKVFAELVLGDHFLGRTHANEFEVLAHAQQLVGFECDDLAVAAPQLREQLGCLLAIGRLGADLQGALAPGGADLRFFGRLDKHR